MVTMSTREVAAYLGVSRSTVGRLKDQLHVVKGARNGLPDHFPRSAVESFLSKQKMWPPRRGGYPHPVVPRLFSGLIIDHGTGCLLWTGACNERGYGHMHAGGREAYVHRLMYELFAGAIPDDLELDHLCRVPRCASPAHLEPVTGAENKRRARAAGPPPKSDERTRARWRRADARRRPRRKTVTK